MELNKNYRESCLTTMSRMPDKFVDVSVTSPPYNLNLRIRNGKYCSRQIVKEISTKYTEFPDNLPIDEFYQFHHSVLKELLRVSKLVFYTIQVVTGSKRAFFKLIGDFNEELKEIIVWDKVNGQPAMKDKVMNSQTEFILVFGDEAISRRFTNGQFNRGELSNIWAIKRGKKPVDSHGAVFPVELIKKILINFTPKESVVYDPFMGTGTTAEAAIETGNNWIGSEISGEYCDITDHRVAKKLMHSVS